MLTLYNYLTSDDNSIVCNDNYFNIFTVGLIAKSTQQNRVIDEICKADNISYIGNLKFKSKFTGTTIYITDISTGAKTVANILMFPSKIVNLSECGDNLLRTIFRFNSGTLYLNRHFTDLDLLKNGKTPIKCVSKTAIFEASGFKEAMIWNENWQDN